MQHEDDDSSFTLADLVHSVQTMRLNGDSDPRERFRIELLGGKAYLDIAWDGDHVSVRLTKVGPDAGSALPPIVSPDEIRKALANYIRSKGGDPQRVTRDVAVSIKWPTKERRE